MIKGCQKKIIMINDTGSDVFDQAYFIVKDNENDRKLSKTDMIREANRIIEENLLGAYFCGSKTNGRKKEYGRFVFFLGALCGGAFVGILWAVVSSM